MKLRYRGRTDVGKTREHNEDDYGFGEGAHVERLGELLVVCDGMGGHASGEVASHLAVETVIARYYEDSGDDRRAVLRAAFEHANQRIHAEGRGSMGTTGVAALIRDGTLVVANVGDSRAYLIRNGTIRQISHDHSLVSEQVAAGVITAEQARSLYYRNVITRALGYQPEVAVDLFYEPLAVGDVVVLCSDGLHGLVADEEILALGQREPIEEAVDALVDLANDRGGSDNITVVIARVESLDTTDKGGLHERVTVELPAAPATVALAATSLAPAAADAPPARSAPQRPAPRRLGPLGALLSAALLIALGAAIFFMSPGTATAPTNPGVTTGPAPTSPEPAPSPVATASPAGATATPAATTSPAATATRAATARPTFATAAPNTQSGPPRSPTAVQTAAPGGANVPVSPLPTAGSPAPTAAS